ncbi:vacuolar assembly sorting protein [Stemphylium lycopersici]|nr:vacuolar assembly sorting protein [Stemphylium lycopersici]
MGVMNVTSETIFNYPPDVIYDFVGNPVNWGRTYKGSAGLPSDAKKLNLPLKVGEVWTEKVALAEKTYHAKWVLEIADRGRKFAFRQTAFSSSFPVGHITPVPRTKTETPASPSVNARESRSYTTERVDMSSDSGESHSSAHNNHGDEIDMGEGAMGASDMEDNDDAQSLDNGPEGLTFVRTRSRNTHEEAQESASELSVRPRLTVEESPASTDTPDDTPSVQGSGISSPTSSVPVSHNSLRALRPTSLQPFERRFSSRLSPSPLSSPARDDGSETPQAPWEVVRWTKLKKITSQVFSEIGKRNFGRPTCLNVTVSLAISTSKGYILIFDYQQVLKSIIGPGTKAVECGSITSLAIAADHSTIAGGHATGHIFAWELAKPAKPFLHISPLERANLEDHKSDGHVSAVAILHLGFLGTRHTALVSADDAGMAFSHLATCGLGAIARTFKTTRILGRYPTSAKSLEKPRKPSSVLAFAPLRLGNVEQPTDSIGLTALLTPYLLVIVSTTPVAQTQHKAPRPKDVQAHSALSGCLAWFPAVKLKPPPVLGMQSPRPSSYIAGRMSLLY